MILRAHAPSKVPQRWRRQLRRSSCQPPNRQRPRAGSRGDATRLAFRRSTARTRARSSRRPNCLVTQSSAPSSSPRDLSAPSVVAALARRTHHVRQVRLTVSSAHGAQHLARRAYLRIAGFMARPRQSAEQLDALARWYRILSEALRLTCMAGSSYRPFASTPPELQSPVAPSHATQRTSQPTAGFRLERLTHAPQFSKLGEHELNRCADPSVGMEHNLPHGVSGIPNGSLLNSSPRRA